MCVCVAPHILVTELFYAVSNTRSKKKVFVCLFSLISTCSISGGLCQSPVVLVRSLQRHKQLPDVYSRSGILNSDLFLGFGIFIKHINMSQVSPKAMPAAL